MAAPLMTHQSPPAFGNDGYEHVEAELGRIGGELIALVYSLQSQLSKDRNELQAFRDQIKPSELATPESRTSCSECSDGDVDATSIPKFPSIGSERHSAGTCKPCAFLHSKGCTSGRNCQFCHLCDEGEKQRRKQKRKSSPGSKSFVAAAPSPRAEISAESTSVTASLESASAPSISSTCLGASPQSATEACGSTSPVVDQTVGSTPCERIPRSDTRMSWSEMLSDEESEADVPKYSSFLQSDAVTADEDVKNSVPSSLPPWRRKGKNDQVQRDHMQVKKPEEVEAGMTISDIKACLSGTWLGSHGECYDIDFSNWTCTRYSPGSSAGSRKFTLSWNQQDDIIRWGSNFVLHLTGLKADPDKVSWQSTLNQRSFQWKRKL